MRALIEDRIQDGAKGTSSRQPSARFIPHMKIITDNSLYFGCRSASKDHHYSSEWDALVRTGLLQYRLSCSRDGVEGTAKVYVQHLLEQDAQSVWDVVGIRAGHVYISGYVVCVP